VHAHYCIAEANGVRGFPPSFRGGEYIFLLPLPRIYEHARRPPSHGAFSKGLKFGGVGKLFEMEWFSPLKSS